MVTQEKQRVICIGIMVILTAFVGMTANVGASGLPPVAHANGPYFGEECNSILLNGSGSTDPEGDPLTYRWYIMGSWIENYYYPYMEWTWFDDFSGTITLEVSDGTSIDTDTTNVTILNVPPVILSIDGPTQVDIETEFLLLVNFFDGMADPRFKIPSLDTYTATFNWDDGTSTELALGVEEFWANASHVYSESGVYHIVITIVDKNGGMATAEWNIIVGGIGLVEAGPDGIIDEGSAFISSGYLADSYSPTYTAIVDYYDETGPQSLMLNPGNTFDLNHVYLDNGIYTVLVTVFNEDVEYGSDAAEVTVNNVPPTIESMVVSPVGPLSSGLPIELSGMFSDPGVLDTHTAMIEWGDGGTSTIDVPFGTYAVAEDHIYESTGVYSIALTVIDKDGGSDSMTVEYSRLYSVMTIDAGPDGFINEGDIFSSAGSLTSVDNNLYTATVDYGDGSGSQPLGLSSDNQFELSHQYLENGVYAILVTIYKDEVVLVSDSVLVTVYNVAPDITSFTSVPTDPCHFGIKLNILGEFTDPGVLDSHIALIEWGDGQTTMTDLPAGISQVSGNHSYTRAGMYTINLTVIDDDGGSDSASIVVQMQKQCYGSGWMKFSLILKCKNGHSPTWEEYPFHLTHLNIHSHMYKCLSTIGTKMTSKNACH